tara:strand:- start:46662 stop:47336 length:675 start_codon:yes stop_codon:yes gene_type:complete
MPKTAGTSFRATLEENFGAGFRHDYQDYPLAHAPPERQAQALQFARALTPEEFDNVNCVHGHFLPVKYLAVSRQLECRFVTWLREPLARLVSHYHYWQRAYKPDGSTVSSLHRRVVEEAWSLEQFCLAPELRNIYHQFMWGFPLERMDFIGITEYYAEDLRYFSTRLVGSTLRDHTLNTRKAEADSWEEQPLSAQLMDQIRAYHASDVQLYAAALERRKERTAQ